MMQPSTALTTVTIIFESLMLATVTVPIILNFVSLMVVGVSESSDLIEAHLISVMLVLYLANTQQS